MPWTINGIGTRYSGKQDLQVSQAVCESCGHESELSSYDTRLWFCLVFIPVIPLGRKRILDDCSRCRRHRAIPLDDYREFQTQALEELGAEYRGDRQDADKAIEYNSALREFGRLEEAQEHLAEILRSFKDDAKVQFYGGVVCEATGRTAEAGRFFDLAFQIDRDYPPARRAQALRQIEAGNLEQAGSLLSPSSLSAEEADPALLFLLAQAYRERGDHVNATQIDQRLIRDFPGIDQDKGFRKAVKSSEKALPSPGTILGKRQLPWGRLILVGGVVALVVGGGLAYNWYLQSHHTVHVVNGYPGAVTVSFDGGDEIFFAEPGHQTVEVAEGKHHVMISGAISDEIEFSIDRTFWSRFNADPAYIVNPRGLAVVIREDITYAVETATPTDPHVRMLAGDSFVEVKGVDYAFVDYPEEIDLPSRKDSVVKRGLSLMAGGPDDLGDWVLMESGPATALRYVEAWLAVEPTDSLVLTYSRVATMAEATGRATEFLHPRLTVSPTNVDWHRAYQQVAQTNGLPALLAEYEGHLAANPGDPDLLYLRGRIDPDPVAALDYYRRTLTAAPRHSFALRGSSHAHMTLGQFALAAGLLQPTRGDGGDDPDLVDSYIDAVIAAGDDAHARRVLSEKIDAEGEEFLWDDALRLALVEIRRGDPNRAEELANRLTQAEGDPFRHWIGAHILYAKNDIGALAQLIRRTEFPYFLRADMEFWVAIETNDQQATLQALREADSATSDGLRELVASLLFARAGKEGAAKEWAAAGLTALTRHRPEAAVASELLAGRRPMSKRAIDLLAVEPRYKAPLLALLAAHFDDDRDWLSAEAKRFSSLPSFPHHFLRAVVPPAVAQPQATPQS